MKMGEPKGKRNNILSLNPFMPKTWEKICFSVFWHNNLVRIETKNNEVRIKVESKQKKKVKIEVFGIKHFLTPNKEYVFQRKKVRLKQNYYL